MDKYLIILIIFSGGKLFSQDNYIVKEKVITSEQSPKSRIIDDTRTYFYCDGQPCQGKILNYYSTIEKRINIKGNFQDALPKDSTFIYDSIGNITESYILHHGDSLYHNIYKNGKLNKSHCYSETTDYNDNGIRTKTIYSCLGVLSAEMTYDSLGNSYSLMFINHGFYKNNETEFAPYYSSRKYNHLKKFGGRMVLYIYKHNSISKIYLLNETYYKTRWISSENEIIKELPHVTNQTGSA